MKTITLENFLRAIRDSQVEVTLPDNKGPVAVMVDPKLLVTKILEVAVDPEDTNERT